MPNLPNQTAGTQWRRTWTLIFEDTFPGPGLDRTKWDSESATFNYGDGSGQQLAGLNINSGGTPDATTCVISAATAGGTGNSLKLIATRGSFSTGGATPDPAPWKTAQINTAAHFGFTMPCRVEGRMKAPLGDGLRPIIWMTHGGAPTMEIDMPEFFTGGTAFSNGSVPTRDGQCTCFWSYSAPTGYQKTFQNYHVNIEASPGGSGGWHDWAWEWTDHHLMWFFDGFPSYGISGGVPIPVAMGSGESFKWANGSPSDTTGIVYPLPYTNANQLHLKLGLQVNGPNSPGGPTTTTGASATPSPCQVEYDYIRVFQGA